MRGCMRNYVSGNSSHSALFRITERLMPFIITHQSELWQSYISSVHLYQLGNCIQRYAVRTRASSPLRAYRDDHVPCRASTGPMPAYRDFVATQCKRNPSIRNLADFLSAQTSESTKCRIVRMDFVSDDTEPSIEHLSTCDLDNFLQTSVTNDKKKLSGRIIVIEDLTREVVEIVGAKLHIDPLFFASHLHNPWPNISIQTPELAMLPSRLRHDTYFSIHYHRTIVFKDLEASERKVFRASNMHRKVVILPKIKGVHLGLAQHSCSLSKTSLSDGTWICVMLVDGPMSSAYHSIREGEKDLLRFNLDFAHFLGGYEDFLDPPSADSGICSNWGPERKCLFDDFLYYWKRERPNVFDWKDPLLLHLAYYPLRIIAAEWINYLTVMNHTVKEYEYTVEDFPTLFQQLGRLNSDLRALQSWRRRCASSQQKIRSVIRFIRHFEKSTTSWDQWDLVAQDYDQLAIRVGEFGHQFERMLPVVTSMVQIADTRRSFAETANVNRLTYLALVFVPLTFTTGLFSMNSENAPGSAGFWVFFAVAVPLTAAVYMIARPPGMELKIIKDYMKELRRPNLPFFDARLGATTVDISQTSNAVGPSDELVSSSGFQRMQRG